MNRFLISMIAVAAVTTLAPTATAQCSEEDPTGTGALTVTDCEFQAGHCAMDSNGYMIHSQHVAIDGGPVIVDLYRSEQCFSVYYHNPGTGTDIHYVGHYHNLAACVEAETSHGLCTSVTSYHNENAHHADEMGCHVRYFVYDDETTTYDQVDLPAEVCTLLLDPATYADEQLPT